jgi:shikimate dehydrogenase
MGGPFAEVIGDPVAHSKSPVIHDFWLKRLGLEGQYRRTRVAAEDLAAYLAGRRDDPDWLGCNVTMPHKQAVVPLLDGIDPEALRIGAVNTVVRENDRPNSRLIGFNSDARGFLEPLRCVLGERHLFRMARVFGGGGSARAIVDGLRASGFALVVAARRVGQAEQLLQGLDPHFNHAAALDHFARPTDFSFDDRSGVLDLVINTTPLGMSGRPPLALDWSHVPPGAIVYDIVYNPVETCLLAEARRRGHASIDGLSMLIGQAAIAFERFFGAAAPRGGDAELRELLSR